MSDFERPNVRNGPKLSNYGDYQPNSGPNTLTGTEVPGLARQGFADQLSIDTPEQVALYFPVAGIGSRFVALLLDHLIQLGVVILAAVLVAVVSATLGAHGSLPSLASKWFLALLVFAFFLLFWGYFALFEAFWHGQTPGKRAMRLRVIKDSGRQITLFESLARNLLRVADYLPSLYLAGVVTMLANKRNKRLGDLAAGTMVVHERAEDGPLLYPGAGEDRSRLAAEATWQPPVTAPAGPFPADAIARLSARDLVVIEAFFARALDLPLEVRAGMAQRILGELTTRMAVAAPAGNPERALEAIGVELRRQRRRL